MKVIVLGAGTAIPAKGYSPAGVYVEVAKEHVLLDAGPGTVQRLQVAGVNPCDIDRVFLTHFHLDHCLDIASLLFALRIPQLLRTKPLAIYGPRGLRQLIRRLNTAFHGWLMPRTYRLTLHELGQIRVRCPGYTVTTKHMTHSTTALGYRLEVQGKRLVYSGDTDTCASIVELGRHTDTLILECSHPDQRKMAGHLTPTECGRIAAQVQCGHLVLTHFYPVFRGVDIRRCVRHHFSGRLTLARDLLPLRI